ncbi:hypothetical protein Ctob_006637 [Chrysochromulina tobinii]|uniref:Prolyl 4-hydroxylase alpha subunit domain-containing protein n=1 Tax=Chrysochromulina tobinii TaxID=1460289 RepID=A0A0M0J5R9_9EUKA|nr:hypothetical protein Ctob_006637 [Chrysochromulina tobinii]|eukprot:KOO21682.1 hypothetical protein Ctob_006637 [Chrysochromulina sp. CCMP291]
MSLLSSHLRRAAASVSAVAAAAAAITMQQYAEFESMVAGSALAEQHLPLSAEAQKTNVVRIPGFLSAREVHEIHELYAELKPRLGSAGRTTSNQAAAYRQGKWETAYLSTDGLFAKCMPELRARLIETAARVDADHWQLLPRAVAPVVPRCVEYHTVEAGGSLPFLTHYDAGSLVTIDVMLSDSRDFEGGEFRTLECDGTMRRYPFEKGDALVFVSHKFHCVTPVTAGRRHVLVMELWEGEERECAHRCERHTGPCSHTVRASFWRRALSDLASDL